MLWIVLNINKRLDIHREVMQQLKLVIAIRYQERPLALIAGKQ
jgi:hypothetical protein